MEYDLKNSSLSTGVMCVKSANPDTSTVCSHRIELSAKPTAVMWHPKLNGDFEDRFVIANDAFKFKEFNLESKQCRRTSLAPRFGNPPSTLLVIPPPPVSEVLSLPTAPITRQYPTGRSTKGEFEEQGEPNPEGLEGQAEEKATEEEEEVEEPVPPAEAALPEYFAFSTTSRVIGISSFPLTGDPSQVLHVFFFFL